MSTYRRHHSTTLTQIRPTYHLPQQQQELLGRALRAELSHFCTHDTEFYLFPASLGMMGTGTEVPVSEQKRSRVGGAPSQPEHGASLDDVSGSKLAIAGGWAVDAYAMIPLQIMVLNDARSPVGAKTIM